jgi:polygalacturonase
MTTGSESVIVVSQLDNFVTAESPTDSQNEYGHPDSRSNDMSDVRDFGAVGDGVTDDTDAIQHAIDDGNGHLEFPRGEYRISKTLLVDMEKPNRTSISGAGRTTKIVMHGPGPAIFLKATHAKTADPSGVRPEEWQHERMPTIDGNLIGSQNNNVHLTGVRRVTISGNYIDSGHHRNLLVEKSRNVVVGPNTFGHNPDYKGKELATGICFEDSDNCVLNGLLIQDA